MRTVLILTATVVLLAAQAAIVGVGLFHPNVSLQYRAFFIDHTITTWDRETPL